jgi:tetratricopeptide (TPR) repeat protein/CBS domain-containing protein
MGTAFAGIVRVPMTSVIMIFEITRDYSIIVPLMMANMISYLISSRLQKEPIYEALMHQDGIYLPVAARDRDELLPVKLGTHSPEAVLDGADRIERVLMTEPNTRIAWPVVDEGGLLGIVSRTQLEDAVNHGQGAGKLAGLFAPIDLEVEPSVDQFPHVHSDQPLETAMRRMAQTNLNLLPVVSRTNLRELVGVISWNDALTAFKLDDAGEMAEVSQAKPKAPIAWLSGVLVVLLVVIALGGFLTYSYRSQRSARADQYFREGNELMAASRLPEAIERFRSALSISHTSRDRLSLALALLKAECPNEAEIYFKEMVRTDPDNGSANLGLARIAVQQGNAQNAADFFHRAIYGFWAENAQINRMQARFEFVEALGKLGQRTQAQAELLSLVAEMPEAIAARLQLGTLLCQYGLPKQAVEIYQTIIRQAPRNGDAYAGLGEATFALDDYRSAEEAFKSALHWNPGDEALQRRLALISQIASMDPTLRGLRAVDRYQRSRALMEAALARIIREGAKQKAPVSV